MKHKLMIKTHLGTGLKYLCYTRSEGEQYNTYKGSGTGWTKHLKKHGDDITTELIFESEDKELFKQEAIRKSLELNVVESEDWANLKIESGDGGATTMNKMWITNGSTEKYINKDDNVPAGWRRGRFNCVFSDSSKQKEFSAKADRSLNGEKLKAAWADPDKGFQKRDHSKCGASGDKNPSKRPEVRAKIRKAALEQSEERSERAKQTKFWLESGRWK